MDQDHIQEAVCESKRPWTLAFNKCPYLCNIGSSCKNARHSDDPILCSLQVRSIDESHRLVGPAGIANAAPVRGVCSRCGEVRALRRILGRRTPVPSLKGQQLHSRSGRLARLHKVAAEAEHVCCMQGGNDVGLRVGHHRRTAVAIDASLDTPFAFTEPASLCATAGCMNTATSSYNTPRAQAQHDIVHLGHIFIL